jgi:hypothetical protein
MLELNLLENAGRAAYLADFHAAEALIFERDRRTLKTHCGVQSEFSRLIKEIRRCRRTYVAFFPVPTRSRPSPTAALTRAPNPTAATVALAAHAPAAPPSPPAG